MKNSSLTSSWNDAWYPPHSSYYDSGYSDQIPVRQGDILNLGLDCDNAEQEGWLGCIVIHPSCEIITRKASKIQVCRVRQLQEHDESMQENISAGESTDSNLNVRVAMAHTFFLAPVIGNIEFSEPMFADFRALALVDKNEVTKDRRVAIMTHNARVYFIRRYLYWRQRWKIPIDKVLALEKVRISRDTDFEGPRPVWAPLSSSITPSG